MAREIAGSDADAEAVACARPIAEAQIDLNRVRDSRRRLITGLLLDPNYEPLPALKQQLRLMKMIDRIQRLQSPPFKVAELEEMTYPESLEGEEKLAAIIEEKASQLAALDRYERRALSRRKFAIRKFDANICCHSSSK
jgi:hypothetical protein